MVGFDISVSGEIGMEGGDLHHWLRALLQPSAPPVIVTGRS